MIRGLHTNLNQLFLRARHRPILYRLGRHQRAHKVSESVGLRMKLETSRRSGERGLNTYTAERSTGT